MVSVSPPAVPGSKLEGDEGDEQELARENLGKYRSFVATPNYIAQDRREVRRELAVL